MISFKKAKTYIKKFGSPVLLLSKNQVKENYRTLKKYLPSVDFYYAVKSNPNVELLKAVKEIDGFFDLASAGEIKILKKLGVPASKCIYTHPIKKKEDIKYALDYGVKLFIIDNEYEIAKLKKFKKDLDVLVRISISNPDCPVDLSLKFGAEPKDALDLIKKAHNEGISVKGISFHVGSQNMNAYKYVEALEYCKDIFKLAALEGIDFEILDIGGGFPVSYTKNVMPVDYSCNIIKSYLEKNFQNFRFIAEPGRFISAASMTLVVSVVGKSKRNGVCWYYIDDGLYSTFSGKVFDACDYKILCEKSGEPTPCVIAGPTCDSFDIVYKNILLPELDIGDILIFPNMGSYASANATNFNCIEPTKIITVDY
ncbi:MAG: type III PLP-dependent enzyme [bacterium]